MRILALSDIHGSTKGLGVLPALMARVDLVLIAGDLTDFGGAEEIRELLVFFEESRSKLVVVPGNCDRGAAREMLASEGLSADGCVLERGGARIAGSGGGLMHSGLTPYERRDEELGASLEALFASLSNEVDHELPLIVLSHTPPQGTGSDLRRGFSLGSRQLRQILDREQPPLWVCGHIHESRSAARSGQTLVVNPGPLKDGCYALVELQRTDEGTWSAEAELPRC